MENKNFLLLGGTAAAVAVGIYVLYGPGGKSHKKEKDLCPGLVNIGNKCFINSVLQSMAACHYVVKWLGDFIDKRIEEEYTKYMAFGLIRIMKLLNNNSTEESSGPYTPQEIIDALRHRRWVISSDEQDAHEFFHVITETLEEEGSSYAKVASLLDGKALQITYSCSQPLSSAMTRYHTALPILPNRESDHPFRGLLASQLQCKLCGYKYAVQHDSFHSLSLSIPQHTWRPLTLDILLQHYVMSESVQNVECVNCAKSKDHSNKRSNSQTFFKRLTIGKLPECLCIHIQRTIWLDNGMPMKRKEYIAFPEFLNMDSYVYHKKEARKSNLLKLSGSLLGGQEIMQEKTEERTLIKNQRSTLFPQTMSNLSGKVFKACKPQNKVTVGELQNVQEPSYLTSEYQYRLASVVVHLGDVFSGHFVTYRRAPSLGYKLNTRWLYCSDELVKRASINEVIGADAYMLFYEKVPL